MPNAATGTDPNEPPLDSIQHVGRVVIVGANGSGKSRLGAWLENPQNVSGVGMMRRPASSRRAYRIGSQRLLAFPEKAQRVDPRAATEQLLSGDDMTPDAPSRVKGDAVVGQSQDFELLLNALFAEQTEQGRRYRARGFETGGSPGVPEEDIITRVKRIWETIFPERALSIGDHEVLASPKRQPRTDTAVPQTYPAGKMSDGERVGFYLAGHALLAPANGVFVIDEPELHLHPSIQSTIWNALEAERKDCTFVYITHDLGFAASRVDAVKVVLYDYEAPGSGPNDVGRWTWTLVPKSAELPEDLVLRIVGARRPTLFVEGVTGSWDQKVYETLYPDFYIIPSGEADLVDKSVRAFSRQRHLHRYEPQGLIDRDDRSTQEIEGLRAKRIHVLPVAGIENMLALPECLTAFAESQVAIQPSDRQSAISNAKQRVLTGLRSRREETISARAQYAVRRRLHQVTARDHTKTGLIQAVDSAVAMTNAGTAYDAAERLVDSALSAQEDEGYAQALEIDNNKAILNEVAAAFRSTQQRFGDAIVELIRTSADLRNALRAKLTVIHPDGQEFQPGAPASSPPPATAP